VEFKKLNEQRKKKRDKPKNKLLTIENRQMLPRREVDEEGGMGGIHEGD